MGIFESKQLQFRRKLLVFAGAKIEVEDTQSGEQVGFIKMKAFKLKEDIKLFSDSTQSNELLAIKARSVIDLGATYDVKDPQTDQIQFSLRRKGLRSAFVRDKWLILDSQGNEYGQVVETGEFALIRRYISIIPIVGDIIDLIFFFMKIDYKLFLGTEDNLSHAATITRQKNPIVIKYSTDADAGDATVDPRVLTAAAMLLSAIEIGKN